MIKETPEGYAVTSSAGKPLSKKNLSLADAMKRLAQVEYFKHRDLAGNGPASGQR